MEEKECLIESGDVGRRLDVFLKEKEDGLSRTRIKALILKGMVLVNGAKVKPHHKLRRNDHLQWQVPDVPESRLLPEDIALEIIFEDQDIIILNKAAGMVVHPGAGNQSHTLVNSLLYHTRSLSSINPSKPGIVHRLDKETSGVMVVAKNNTAHHKIAKQFRKHTIERRYIALVSGRLEFDEGVVDVPIKRHSRDRKRMMVSFAEGARPAHTHYRTLRRYEEFTAVELFPKTGRTHQLRVHLSYLGHPILGDARYGKKNFSRLALHAKDLGFVHPTTGEFVKFSSPLPAEMKSVIEGLEI